MSKLNLVIADIDELYVKGLSGYVNIYHSAVFAVSCFTKIDSFIGYMEQQPSIDVLLIGSEFYSISSAYNNIKLKVILTGDSMSQVYPGFQVISKYSTGEKLLGELIHLYSKLDPSEMRFSTFLKGTGIIGVYSPSGGTGKTTIAAALSTQSNELGLRSFYLNLESIQSTGIFFDTSSKRNLSYVFYYLKEKSNNLSFRMEGIKSSDKDDGADYFGPPESPLEYGEIDTVELEQLIDGIKGMGCYDYIFIDMSSVFDVKNYRIMNLCDHILLVTLQEPYSLLKNSMLLNELEKLNDTDLDRVSDKLITVINKYKDKRDMDLENPMKDADKTVRVPEYTRTLVRADGRVVIDDENFRKSVKQLINLISGK